MAQVSKHVKRLGAGAKIPGSFCAPSSSSNLRSQPVHPETGSESQRKSGFHPNQTAAKTSLLNSNSMAKSRAHFSFGKPCDARVVQAVCAHRQRFFANLATPAVGKSPV